MAHRGDRCCSQACERALEVTETPHRFQDPAVVMDGLKAHTFGLMEDEDGGPAETPLEEEPLEPGCVPRPSQASAGEGVSNDWYHVDGSLCESPITTKDHISDTGVCEDGRGVFGRGYLHRIGRLPQALPGSD